MPETKLEVKVNGDVDHYRAELQRVGDAFEDSTQETSGPVIGSARAGAQMLQAGCERVIREFLISSGELEEIYNSLTDDEFQVLVEVAAIDLATGFLSASCESATGAIFNRYMNIIKPLREKAKEEVNCDKP